MRRRPFNFAVGVSMVLCVATVLLWIRSAVGPVGYQRQVWDEAALTWRLESVSLFDGILRVGGTRQQLRAPPHPNTVAVLRQSQAPWTRHAAIPVNAADNTPDSELMLYSFNSEASRSDREPWRQWALRLRLWPVAIIAALLPGVWVSRKVRLARRVRMGCCLSCGYDLRASPGRCPECGAVPAAVEGAAMQAIAEAK